MRHRSGAPPPDTGDSSSDEDAFSALARKKKNRKKSLTASSHSAKEATSAAPSGFDNINVNAKAITNETSSNKRHHHLSSRRTAKMDAVLQELIETPIPESSERKGSIPDKMGSYCLPGEEESTTNIFVGNVSPLTTEEQLSDIFRQFGDLYSVKIMWPRTGEEMARGRNTGFVCFMNRDDAQDAMDTLQETDPLNNGRVIFLNWGRNVKKVVKRGAGGIPIPPIRGFAKTIDSNKRTTNEARSNETTAVHRSQDEILFNPILHASSAIRVVAPSDPARSKFISTVASFVAKDGSSLEDKLMETEAGNPTFSFLETQEDDTDSNAQQVRDERVFYRWRVFSFCQGDSFFSWRTEPFIMIEPGGHFWIPPPQDPTLLAQNELKNEQLQLLKQQRRQIVAARKGYHTMTGRQIEKSRRKTADGHTLLSSQHMEVWTEIIANLCGSRNSICEAMAFCFENSFAAQHICQMLKTCLMDNRRGISIETKCARLFLLSDILFNSQQIGVKNAFRYRDAIEQMAPEVFKRLGEHGNGCAGRITMNKLRSAIRKVLSAWNSWSVYSDIFLDQLEASFEGKIIAEPNIENDVDQDISKDKRDENIGDELVSSKPSSIWMDSSKTEPVSNPDDSNKVLKDEDRHKEGNVDGESFDDEEINPSTLIDEEIDGESLGESEIADSDYEEETPDIQIEKCIEEESLEISSPDEQN
jgi:U2-associated protein SR140